jgi:hypothetical protein
MPSHQCRLNAERCLQLAERAGRPEMRQNLTALAETWTRLAAQLESDEALLSASAGGAVASASNQKVAAKLAS